MEVGGACSLSTLQLFDLPPVQVVVEKSSHHYIQPDASITNAEAPIKIRVVSDVNHFVDLSETMLYVEMKIVKADGKPLTKVNIAPVNLFLHSLFSQVDVNIGGTSITSGQQTYPYLAYLQTLLSYGPAAKQSWLAASGFYKDVAHRMDDTTAIEIPADAKLTTHNEGLENRFAMIQSSNKCQLIGRLHNGIFATDRLMVPGVPFNVTFQRSKKEFLIMKPANIATDVKIELTDFGLFVKLVKVADRERMYIESQLAFRAALYPFTRAEVMLQTMATGDKSVRKNNVVIGTLPKKMGICFIGDDASSGSYQLNPFNFKHYGITRISISVNNEAEPTVPYIMDFSGDPSHLSAGAMRAYLSIYAQTGRLFEDSGIDITPSDFHGGYAIYMFDLNPIAVAGCISPSRNGTVSVHADFDTALPSTVNMVIYAEYDSLLTVDLSRGVTKDY